MSQSTFGMGCKSEDKNEKRRYLRRLNKLEIARVIFEKLGLEFTEDEKSNGSTIKKTVLLKIWGKVNTTETGPAPSTKHKLLEKIHLKLGQAYDSSEDTSTSSTITKIGLLKVLIGVQSMNLLIR